MTGLCLLLAASLGAIRGEDALRHARALAALGPHAFGSPRAQAAAAYVAAGLRDAGLAEVRLQPFASDGRRGQNVIGTLAGLGPEFVVIAAHHDSAPDAPGAYDDGGGVGVLIETARVLARGPKRPHTLVFVSFDGEESESQGSTPAAGSRAYVEALGPQARALVAALAIEMCGQKDGVGVIHPIAYPDPLRPGAAAIAPAWLMRVVLAGARGAGAPLEVGDPWLGLVYQPAVRAFRVRLYADDRSFLQAGLPAVFVSDSSFTRFYPHYHSATDSAERLDAAALQRMGQGVVGIAEALARTPLSREREAVWLAAFGMVFGMPALALVALASLLPALDLVRRGRGARRAAGLCGVALFGLLLWRSPVPALYCLAVPAFVLPLTRSRWGLLSLLPAATLLGLGGAAWLRQAGPEGALVTGLWLAPWELLGFGLALGALWLARPPGAGPVWRKAAGPKRKRQ